MPGKWTPAALRRKPAVASIATRPCFNSAAWNHRSVSSPRSANPSGSKLFSGAVFPGKPFRVARATIAAFEQRASRERIVR